MKKKLTSNLIIDQTKDNSKAMMTSTMIFLENSEVCSDDYIIRVTIYLIYQSNILFFFYFIFLSFINVSIFLLSYWLWFISLFLNS